MLSAPLSAGPTAAPSTSAAHSFIHPTPNTPYPAPSVPSPLGTGIASKEELSTLWFSTQPSAGPEIAGGQYCAAWSQVTTKDN